MSGRHGVRIYGGVTAASIVAFVWLLSRLSNALRRMWHPLTTSPATGRACDESVKIRGTLGLTKVVVHGGKVRFVLDYPAWPSRAYSRMVARGGLNLDSSGTARVCHVHTIYLGITSVCPLRCQHCYARSDQHGEPEVPPSRWKEVLDDIQELGVGVVVLSGGEPMCCFDGLVDILSSGDTQLSEFHVHTSGYGVTSDRARQLRRAGLSAAGIGFDHWAGERFDEIRGYPGAFDQATQAIRSFREAGVFTYLNTCLTKELVRSGGLPRLLDAARNLGVGMVRLIEPKPCGGYFWEDPRDLFSDEDHQEVEEFFLSANRIRRFRRHPLVLVPSHTEAPHQLGCRMGGQSILEIDCRGNVQPCLFVPVSFGNVLREDFADIFSRMRQAVPRPVRAPCPAVTLSEAIRTKTASGIPLPLPYSAVRDEFDAVVCHTEHGRV